MRAITKNQVTAVRTIASKVFSGDDQYRDFLRSNFPALAIREANSGEKISTKWLSFKQARTIISEFESKNKTKKKKHRYRGSGKKGANTDWLTQAQADEIERLEDELGWSSNPKRLRGLIKRIIHKNCTPEMLMAYEASNLIKAMTKMARG